MKDIALSLALSFMIFWVSEMISGYFAGIFIGKDVINTLMAGMLGNKYLIMTTITMLLATYIPKFFNNLGGAQEIGTFFIYCYWSACIVATNY